MANTHRMTTAAAAAIILSFAVAGAPAASAKPADYVPAGKQATANVYTPASSVYSRPDKSIIPSSSPATSGGAINRSAARRSLAEHERQRVAGISALSDKQLAAAFGAAPPVANKASAARAVVRAQTLESGFDWGDAGIGAAAGFMLAMLGLGGGLVISRQRPQRTRRTTALPN